MCTIILEENSVEIPESVRDLKSFRRWTHSDQFPQQGRFSWLNGQLWVDLSMEELFTHNLLKTHFAAVLSGLVHLDDSGYLLTDGMFFSNVQADIANEPDGMFLSFAGIQSGRVRLLKTKHGYMEVQGSPDMVLEVVSFSSVGKDKTRLRELYHRAEVREYWLVDVRQRATRPIRRASTGKAPTVRFEILRHTPDGYVPAERTGGWIRSDVFDRSFRLKRSTDRLGHPQFTLETR